MTPCSPTVPTIGSVVLLYTHSHEYIAGMSPRGPTLVSRPRLVASAVSARNPQPQGVPQGPGKCIDNYIPLVRYKYNRKKDKLGTE